jgi:chemotaxis family two-component system response regulator Rcp1
MAVTSPQWRILLVEDSPGDVLLMRMALKEAKLDAELTVLNDGAEALAFVRREGKYASAPKPDLIVLDKMLPKAGGAEILADIRSSEHFRNVSVVLMTSVAMSHAPRHDLWETDHQIVKPLSLQEYLNIGTVLKNILQQSKSSGTSRAVGT